MKPSFLSRYRGELALLGGAVLFSVMALSVKFAAKRLPAAEVVMFRFMFGLVVLQIAASLKLIDISHDRFKVLAARGLSGGLAILFYFLSIKHTHLSKAVILSNAYPVFAALFGIVILRERVGVGAIAAFAASALGIYLVVDPDFGHVAAGDLYGVLSATFAGLAIVVIRELRSTHNPFSIFWYLCVAGTLIGAVGCLFSFAWPTPAEWAWLLVIGVSSTVAQLLTTYGFGFCLAAEGATIAMSTVAYSALLGWFVLGERLPALALAGAALVVVSAIALGARGAKPPAT